MVHKLLFLLTIIVSCDMGLLRAQTCESLLRNYGHPQEGGYVIRPGLVLKARFANDGHFCRIDIQPKSAEVEGGGPSGVMSSEIAEELVNEVLPVPERGKLITNGVTKSSCLSVQWFLYQQVSVSFSNRCEEQGAGTFQISIVSQAAQCTGRRGDFR